MDPVSLTASIVAIVQLSNTVTAYLKQWKDGSEDRVRLREEIKSTAYMLEILNDRVEDARDADTDLSSIKSLDVKGGPL